MCACVAHVWCRRALTVFGAEKSTVAWRICAVHTEEKDKVHTHAKKTNTWPTPTAYMQECMFNLKISMHFPDERALHSNGRLSCAGMCIRPLLIREIIPKIIYPPIALDSGFFAGCVRYVYNVVYTYIQLDTKSTDH